MTNALTPKFRELNYKKETLVIESEVIMKTIVCTFKTDKVNFLLPITTSSLPNYIPCYINGKKISVLTSIEYQIICLLKVEKSINRAC